MSALLAAGATVDQGNQFGCTPLITASQQGHGEVVTQLLAAGATVDLADKCGRFNTPLMWASHQGHGGVVSQLLAAGATVDLADQAGYTPLSKASRQGHGDVVSQLLVAGATVDQGNQFGYTPLMMASEQGHGDVVSQLLGAGADFNHADVNGHSAMAIASILGQLACAQMLSSYGAKRTFQKPYGAEVTAERFAVLRGHEALAAWLVESRHWSTPLHHLRIIGADRARELLRGGADLNAAAAAGGPTPLSLAQALRAAGDPDAADGSAASLVLAAAERWGAKTHALFPAAARSFAAELLLLGHQLSRQPRFAGEEVSLVDAWTQLVMPSAIVR